MWISTPKTKSIGINKYIIYYFLIFERENILTYYGIIF